eukprot:TRINITY_DN10756_c0_g2_i2.p1 TRINITY_DN10756_c0_g2~~TRINITY_DN10756_c0_g2_i2.p1  ORF type:complete len:555 (-),score=157.28 TRINITY_DN10756_c0_g2_i2:62-1690(-)
MGRIDIIKMQRKGPKENPKKKKAQPEQDAGAIDQKKAYFEKALQKNPSDWILYSNRAAFYSNMKLFKDSLEDAQRAILFNREWAEGYLYKGIAEFYEKKYEDALSSFERVHQLDPGHPQLMKNILKAHYRLEEAKRQRYGERLPDDFSKSLIEKVKLYPELHHYLEDKDFIEKLKSIDANPASLYLLMKDQKFQTKLNEVSAAVQAAMTAPIPINANPAEEEKSRGNQEYRSKNFEEAIKFYDSAIEKNPRELTYYYNKTAVFIEQKEFEKALSVCDDALKVIDRFQHTDAEKIAKIYARKGTIHRNLGDLLNAVVWLERSMAWASTATVREELDKVLEAKQKQDDKEYVNEEIGAKMREEGNQRYSNDLWEEAIRLYQEAIRRNPNDAKAYSNTALCALRLKQNQMALQMIEKALQIEPNYAKAVANKAKILEEMKDYARALQTYHFLVKLEPEKEEHKESIRRMEQKIDKTEQEKEKKQEEGIDDPMIRELLEDPEVKKILMMLQVNPDDPALQRLLESPEMASKVQKLIEAGILSLIHI